MKKISRWAVIALGVAAVGIIPVVGLRAQAGQEMALPAIFNKHPVLEILLKDLVKWSELRKDLGLTRDQKRTIAEILRSRKPEIAQTLIRLGSQRKEVLAAVRAETPDEAAIRAAVTNMTETLVDAAVLRSQIRRQTIAILTPEQRGKLDSFLSDLQSSMDEALVEFQAQ